MHAGATASIGAPSFGGRPQPRPPSERPHRWGPQPSPGPDILLVEDSAADAEYVRELFGEQGQAPSLRHVTSLREAVETLPGSFRLILLDLGLPDGRGLDVLAQVSRVAGATPIVVLTGNADTHLARRCLEHGAQDYLNKDELDAHALMRAIDFAAARERARLLSQRLEHADRLATMGQLAATVAHEVNNPAAFIQLNTEDLLTRIDTLAGQTQGPDPDTLRTWLTDARGMLADNLDGIERVTRLVQDLRVFARTDTARPEPVDVEQLCRSTCALAAHHVQHRGRLVLDLAPTPIIVADRGRLGQVIMNLVVNAAQSLEGGIRDNEVRLETRSEPGWIVISVRDSGRGMNAEELGRVFERFYSTKGSRGTGLGLSICYDLVEAMRGKIEVYSEVGRGSCFVVRIPAKDTVIQPPRPRQITPPAAVLPRRRILLVDDDDALVRALRRGLAKHHDVTTAPDGRAALALLTLGASFDTIICDLMMPRMDGVELVAHLDEQFAEHADRVIVLSGGASTERTRHFVQYTACPVLAKPVRLPDLERAIETIVGKLPHHDP